MKQTPLFEKHKECGAKMGEFAGYDMPLYYEMGVIKEHEWVRDNAGLFDVSHMGQIIVSGRDATVFWETVTPSNFQKLKNDKARYTVLTNEQGGIIDDLIVTRLDKDEFFAVINAGRKAVDIEWLNTRLPAGVALERRADYALLALQGPKAAQVLFEVFGLDTQTQGYMQGQKANLAGAEAYVSRLGYTGEDGFEISVPGEAAPALWDALLINENVKPIGLAARDSLRLDMGYCLYGHDIDETTTPIEAGLKWVVSAANETYIGRDVIQKQIEDGVSKKRVGIILRERGVAREGSPILSEDGQEIGVMTSGGFSPSLKKAIGQGYVQSGYTAAGTPVRVEVRGKLLAAEIATMPLVEAGTKTGKS